MPAKMIERAETAVTIQVTIPLSRSMLDSEEAIQKALTRRVSWPPPRPSSSSTPMAPPWPWAPRA